MTEDHKRLLAVFEVRVRDLMALCDQQKRRIDELTAALSLKDEELRQAKEMIEGLNAKCDNMLTARIVSTNEEEMKNARMRLAMDEEFLINIVIAGKKYPLTIKRHEEELARAAADQINSKILQYRQHFAVEVDTKDLLAMVAFQLSMHNLELEKRNDTNPFTDKIQELTTELEGYLKK